MSTADEVSLYLLDRVITEADRSGVIHLTPTTPDGQMSFSWWLTHTTRLGPLELTVVDYQRQLLDNIADATERVVRYQQQECLRLLCEPKGVVIWPAGPGHVVWRTFGMTSKEEEEVEVRIHKALNL